MGYSIEMKPAAVRELKNISKSIQRRIASRIDSLANNPRPVGVEKLSQSDRDFYRIRIGEYRLIYEINDENALILVIRIGHRRDI